MLQNYVLDLQNRTYKFSISLSIPSIAQLVSGHLSPASNQTRVLNQISTSVLSQSAVSLCAVSNLSPVSAQNIVSNQGPVLNKIPFLNWSPVLYQILVPAQSAVSNLIVKSSSFRRIFDQYNETHSTEAKEGLSPDTIDKIRGINHLDRNLIK